jgi:uncharacterized membrane protein YgcG
MDEMNNSFDTIDDLNQVSSESLPETVPANDSTKKKKKKWVRWGIPVASVLIIALLAALLWEPILLRFAPNLYTSIVLNNTMNSLGKRADSGLGAVIKDATETLSDGTIDVNIAGKNKHNGREITQNISIISKLKDKKVQIGYEYQDVVPITHTKFDLYLDMDIVAIRSDLMENGQFYGLKYDNFSDELKNSSYGQYLTDDEIQQYDRIVQQFDDMISNDKYYETIFEAYIDIVEDYIASLKPEQEKEFISLDGEDIECLVLTYEFTEEDVTELMKDILEEMEDDTQLRDMMMNQGIPSTDPENDQQNWLQMIEEFRNTLNTDTEGTDPNTAEMKFYVYHSRVVVIEFEPNISAEAEATIRLSFGKDPRTSDIILETTASNYGITQKTKLTFQTDEEPNESKYRFVLENDVNGKKIENNVEIIWDRENVTVYSDGEKILSFGLKEINKGYRFSAKEIQVYKGDSLYIDLTIDVQKKATLNTPNYIPLKDMDMITLDELMSCSGYRDPRLGLVPKVTDPANAMTDTAKAELEATCRHLARKYGVDVVVSTVEVKKTPTLKQDACSLFVDWGYGFGSHDDGYIIMYEEVTGEFILAQMGHTCTDLWPDQNQAVIDTMKTVINNGGSVDEALKTGVNKLESYFGMFYE